MQLKEKQVPFLPTENLQRKNSLKSAGTVTSKPFIQELFSVVLNFRVETKGPKQVYLRYFSPLTILTSNWLHWHILVVLATQEDEVGGSFENGSWRSVWAT